MLYEEGKEVDMGAMKDIIAWARKMYAAAKDVTFKVVEPPCPGGPDAQGYCGSADEEWSKSHVLSHGRVHVLCRWCR